MSMLLQRVIRVERLIFTGFRLVVSTYIVGHYPTAVYLFHGGLAVERVAFENCVSFYYAIPGFHRCFTVPFRVIGMRQGYSNRFFFRKVFFL